jgi:hypothetical protein
MIKVRTKNEAARILAGLEFHYICEFKGKVFERGEIISVRDAKKKINKALMEDL